ncbi:Asp-tRNA(Asn)/Glu-tRNA(Gln) amidotransferase subunit GatC [Candidatus Saccharibacteria bacterium]|nr:Asp-tRNA(Asn)/Glu-tRNA(Gln) amidotransferase subunit GatC [Candidatus Saccharibacteria bacterium]
MGTMIIAEEEIERLAELSSLSLTSTEKEQFRQELSEANQHVDYLNELDTDGVEPTYQVGDLENVWRPDEVVEFEAKRDDLLALAPETEDNQVKVPRVL